MKKNVSGPGGRVGSVTRASMACRDGVWDEIHAKCRRLKIDPHLQVARVTMIVHRSPLRSMARRLKGNALWPGG